jgi:uncharacterized membrane protein YhaH (DUF805 family)
MEGHRTPHHVPCFVSVGFRLSGEQRSVILPSTDAVSGAREGDMTTESSHQIQSFDWQKLLFSFEGRTRRSHFWIGWLICLGVSVVAGWIPVIGFFISIALIWPNLAISVKRLHDMGKSGWLIAIPWVASIVGIFVAVGMIGVSALTNTAALEREDPAAIVALVGPAIGLFGLLLLVNLGFLLWIGLSDGQSGDNRYGPNPKGL